MFIGNVIPSPFLWERDRVNQDGKDLGIAAKAKVKDINNNKIPREKLGMTYKNQLIF